MKAAAPGAFREPPQETDHPEVFARWAVGQSTDVACGPRRCATSSGSAFAVDSSVLESDAATRDH
ncbi:MAG TPA: hypothetical protein VJR50_20940, partial [Mycobacterium sp.]|nr:hypothetical protein [Mycobacterium sp.]